MTISTSERVRCWSICVGCWIAYSLPACGGASIAPPSGPHRADVEPAPMKVQVAPPPSKIEMVPLRRNADCVYVDGHYHPEGSSWVWHRGRWVLAPSGCYYAPPWTGYERIEGGTTLVFRGGVWLPRSGRGPMCDAPSTCPIADSGSGRK